MARIELRNIQKYFGAVQVLNEVNLTIEDGEFVVMLGQSGCGKTTMLRAIAGLETVSSGTISIDGREVQDLRASDRDIAPAARNPDIPVRTRKGGEGGRTGSGYRTSDVAPALGAFGR